ncbi:MAG TPA: YCF48-related protein [Candidatus Binatia bacterium]
MVRQARPWWHVPAVFPKTVPFRKEAPGMRAKASVRVMAWVLPAMFALSSLAHAQVAETVTPREIRQNLFDTCFPTPTEGWVVGDLGRVFKTTDGGRTWQRQIVSGRLPFLGISCLDGKQAWISSTNGRVFKTSDGGATWTEQKTPVDRNLFKIAFVSPTRGTAVGDFGAIVHTEDGGATWEEIQLPEDFKLPDSALDQGILPNDALLYGLSFANENTGWIAGEFGTILRTDDGGRTWKQQVSGIESTLFGIDFLDENTGIAVGIDSVILRTDDGGATWKPIPSPFDERSYYEVALSGNYGWIVGGQGTVLVSTDGGKEWKQYPTPLRFASEWFRGVSLSGDQGFFVGGAGLIYETKGAEATLLRAAATSEEGNS